MWVDMYCVLKPVAYRIPKTCNCPTVVKTAETLCFENFLGYAPTGLLTNVELRSAFHELMLRMSD